MSRVIGNDSLPEPPTMLPEAHNGCRCNCHTIPGVRHCVPCCSPGDDSKCIICGGGGVVTVGSLGGLISAHVCDMCCGTGLANFK